MKNNVNRKSLVFTIVFLLTSIAITIVIGSNTSIFSDNFNDGDISDWTITTSGNGIFETSTTKYVSSPYSAHMKSLNQYDQAMAVSPSYSLDLTEDYEISFYFLIPSTNNHWFEVFNNHQIYLLIDSSTQLKWYDGISSHSIMSLTTNQWYIIEIEVKPSSDTYDIYINSQYKTTCDIWTHSGFEYSFRIGDRNNDQGSYFDYGEAYWDDFEICQNINNPPETPSQPNGPLTGNRNIEYNYTTSTTDPEGNNIFYLFDWDDGTDYEWYGPFYSGETCTRTHIWTNLGTYNIKVKAKDQYNEESGWSPTTTVVIENIEPPIPDVPLGPTSIVRYTLYIYSTNPVTDPDDDDVEYLFDWGDGTDSGWIISPSASHQWDDVDIFDVKVKSRDYWDESDWSNTLTVVVNNQAPNKPNTPLGPNSGKVGITYEYITSGSDPDGDTLEFFFNWDDGTNSGWIPQNSASHQWDSEGIYNIKVKTRDNWDESEWSNTHSITITSALIADAHGPYEGIEGIPIQFTGSATGGVTPYSWHWDFGDGNTSISQNPIYTYYKPGTYNVILSVEDEEENDAVAHTTATIQPALALVCEAGGPYFGHVNETINFTGLAAGGNPPYSFYWEFGDGNTSDVQNPSHAYAASGEYIAILTVVDSTDDPDSEVNDTAQVTIYGDNDTTSPIVEIHKPINAIYINDNEIIPFFVPLIFGDIQIWPHAFDNESGLQYLELYIDDELKEVFTTLPKSWNWDEFSFGKRTIKLVAYDFASNIASVELDVWKFF